MTGNEVVSLDTLAARINAKIAEVETAHRTTLERAREAGELLIQAKEQVDHGQWLPWLEAHCHVSVDMAGKWMKLSREWPELEAKFGTVPNVGVKEALKLLAKPRETKPVQAVIEGKAAAVLTPTVSMIDMVATDGDATPVSSETGGVLRFEHTPAPAETQEAPSVEAMMDKLEAVLLTLPVSDRTKAAEGVQDRMEMFLSEHCHPHMTLNEIVGAMPGTSLPKVRKEVKAYIEGLTYKVKLFRSGGEEATSRKHGEDFIRLQKEHGWSDGGGLVPGEILHFNMGKAGSAPNANLLDRIEAKGRG